MRDTRGRIVLGVALVLAALALFLWEPGGGRVPHLHPPAPIPPAQPGTVTPRPAVPPTPATQPGTAAPAAGPQPGTAAPASISGTVVDDRGDPIVGAIVQIMPISGHPGAARTVPAPTGPAQGFDVTPTPGQNLGVTTGEVPPIPAADWPSVAGLASPMLVHSGADGRFRVDGIPPSVVEVVAANPAHSPGRSRPITVAAGASVTNVELVMRTLRGH